MKTKQIQLNDHEGKYQYHLVIVSLLIPLLFLIIVKYTPVLNESIIGYLSVFLYIPLFGAAILSPVLLYDLVRQLIKKRPIHRDLTLSVISSVIIFLYVFFGSQAYNVFPLPLPSRSDSKIFSKQVWIGNKLDDPTGLSPRQEMLQDTVKKFPGKTRKEIIELLGDKFSPFPFHYSSNADLKYYLGDSRTVSPGEEWLFIWFDEHGKFKKFEIVTYNA